MRLPSLERVIFGLATARRSPGESRVFAMAIRYGRSRLRSHPVMRTILNDAANQDAPVRRRG